MIISNYNSKLLKNEVLIKVPCKYAFDDILDDLALHLINLGFDVKITPTVDDSVYCFISQDTVMRVQLLGALSYYKIKDVNYIFAIEQNNNTLWINPNLFE